MSPTTPPPPSPTSGVKEGSVLSEAVPVGELENLYLKVGIYGPNRVGKTTLACTFPKPLLLVSFELNPTGGAMSVRRVPGVDYLKVTQTEKAFRLAEELEKSLQGYKTLVIDSVTAYQDLFLKEILNLSSLPEQIDFGGVSGEDYRRRSERVKEGVRPFLNLPCHTVVISKERDHNPPKEERVNPRTGKLQPDMRPKFLRGMQQKSYVTFDLGGAAAGWLYDQLDYVGRLYLDKEVVVRKISRKAGNAEIVEETAEETGRYVRRLRTLPHPNFAAGFRSEVPENLPEYIEEPTYEKLLAVIRGGEGK